MSENTVVEIRGKTVLKRGGLVAGFGLFPMLAMAAPDSAAIVTAVDGVSTTVDAVGGSMITLFVGLMVFGVIIGMIARKGK